MTRSAKMHQDAVEEAKKRFAELEGIPDCTCMPVLIEVGALDAEPSASTRGG